MISIFAFTARLEVSTEESIATPCSVKANGRYLMFRPLASLRPGLCFKVTNCDLDRSARIVVPAKAGIHVFQKRRIGPRFRGGDHFQILRRAGVPPIAPSRGARGRRRTLPRAARRAAGRAGLCRAAR